MVHNPKHKVHSFRGLLADDGQDEINLERQNANVAYRITKLSLFPQEPGDTAYEHVVKIYRESQSSIDGIVNFTDSELLAAAYLEGREETNYTDSLIVVFDNVLFSRNIYITQSEIKGSRNCNYYIELEEVPVSASALMQLKLGVARRLNLEQ